MKKDENCLFCKIIEGKIPASKIYEDDKVVAFLDIYPVNKGHSLVVPKSHSRNLVEDEDKDLAATIIVVKKISKAILSVTGAQGINIQVNCGNAAGQTIIHTHFHLIPRFEGDGLKLWAGKKYEVNEEKIIKEKIIEDLA
jgi:histidine triad (HIT) family protein